MRRFFERLLLSLKKDGRDWTIFSISLLSAFTIWFIHNLSSDYSELIRVRITASSNISGHADVSSNSCEVTARCRTSGYNILKSGIFGGGNRQVSIKPGDLHPKGGDMFYLTTNALNEYSHEIFGEKVSVEYYLSDTLFFRFPAVAHKKVPVRPVASLDFEPQYMSTAGLVIDPDSVMIYGEPYHLDNVDRVLTKNVRLENLKSGTSGVVSLEKIRGIRMSEESVHYSISVSRFVEIRQEVQIGTRNVPADKEMMIYPSRATVTLKCVYPMVPNMTEMSFYVDYDEFVNSISGKCLVRSDALPVGILGYEIEPQVFECVVNEI